MSEHKSAHIDTNTVKEAVLSQIPTIAAHLDLEGFCYVKIVRTAKDGCFAQDLTSGLLRGEHVIPRMTYQEMDQDLWQHPACERFA
jgi:hypothetical protein